MTPLKMMILGGCLLVLGVVLPFLMVTQVIEPTFALSFLAHGSSVAGMILGFYGLINYADTSRNK